MNGMNHIPVSSLQGCSGGEEQKLVNTTKRRRPKAVFSWFSSANFVAPNFKKYQLNFTRLGRDKVLFRPYRYPT
jgi:hypothetical protein